MNLSEVISSGLLESYVLGTATAEETALVSGLCKKHPELVKEIESIESCLIRFSEQTARPLNPALKQKIMDGLPLNKAVEPSSPEKVIALQKPADGSRLKLYRFAMAASLLLFITSFVYNILQQKQISRSNSDLAELSAAESAMAEQIRIQQASVNKISKQFEIVTSPQVKNITLNGMNYLAKSSAAVHWNTETSEVYFDASQLPASPASKQYQLWAIVDGKPVDAGMIDANAAVVFQKMKSVKGAQAFAVTIEQAGGSAAPTLGTMCLLGNV